MENRIEKFIRCCGELCKSFKEFDKESVKKNNRAQTQLYRMSKKICQDKQDAEMFFTCLMDNDDLTVRQTAAAYALQNEICVERAYSILYEAAHSDNKYAAFNAEATLYVWASKKQKEL